MCNAVEVIIRDRGVAAKEISIGLTAGSPPPDSFILPSSPFCCFFTNVVLESRVFLDATGHFIFLYFQHWLCHFLGPIAWGWCGAL